MRWQSPIRGKRPTDMQGRRARRYALPAGCGQRHGAGLAAGEAAVRAGAKVGDLAAGETF